MLRTILSTRHRFREWGKDDATLSPEIATRYRTHELPEQMWIIEIHDKSLFNPGDRSVASRVGEIVLDAGHCSSSWSRRTLASTAALRAQQSSKVNLSALLALARAEGN